MQTNRKIYKNTHYKKSLLIILLQKRGEKMGTKETGKSVLKKKDAILFTGIGTYAASASPALLLPLRKLKA
jgi:hypothetical protein